MGTVTQVDTLNGAFTSQYGRQTQRRQLSVIGLYGMITSLLDSLGLRWTHRNTQSGGLEHRRSHPPLSLIPQHRCNVMQASYCSSGGVQHAVRATAYTGQS